MSKSRIPTIVRTALAVCEIPHQNVAIFNERRRKDRRVKICGLPYMTDQQVRILANAMTYQIPVASLQKHKEYDVKSSYQPYKSNALVLITTL